MIAPPIKSDDEAIASLLWQVKAIATKEYEDLPCGRQQAIFLDNLPPQSAFTEIRQETPFLQRSRAVSMDATEIDIRAPSSPLVPAGLVRYLSDSDPESPCSIRPSAVTLDHRDWSKGGFAECLSPKSVIAAPQLILTHKYGKRKREKFVGQASAKGSPARATLRKKFSWKQYPELEGFLVANQDEYFEFSSKNYTAEQRQYNNTLTRGLLDLAAEEGYIFEEFTFSMVRDRIRCYYKSHSQSAKKKRRR